MSRHTATADAPLPLEEFAELAEVDQLKAALAEALDLLEHPERIPAANRVRRLRRLAGRAEVPGDSLLTPEQRRDEGIARAAARWTPEEAALVDTAIRAVAQRKAADYRAAMAGEAATYDAGDAWAELLELTTADVWAELAGAVPVTKGIAGRMLAAQGAGLIVSTGRTTKPGDDVPGPNHGQRLTVWRAL